MLEQVLRVDVDGPVEVAAALLELGQFHQGVSSLVQEAALTAVQQQLTSEAAGAALHRCGQWTDELYLCR